MVRILALSSIICLLTAMQQPARAEDNPPAPTLNASTLETGVSPRQLNKKLATEKLLAAKRLVADAVPEDRLDAETLLIDAIRMDPYAVEAYFELARYIVWQVASNLRDQADLHLALELAQQARDLAPERPLGDYAFCETLFAMGRTEDAQRVCRIAQEAFPHHLDTLVFRARFLSESHPDQAIEAAQQALSAGASYDDLSPAVVTALTKAAEPGKEGEVLTKFATVYPDRWVWHHAGLAYVKAGKPQQAIAAFKKAIELGNALESRLQLAVVAYTQLNNIPLAVQELKALQNLLHQHTAVRSAVLSGVSGHLALALLKSHRFAEATVAAHEAVLFDVQNTPLMQTLVEAFRAKKQGQTLVAALQQVAHENPALEYVHEALGELAAENSPAQAVKHYTDALALSPQRDELYAARAHIEYSMNNIVGALEDFEAAIHLKPEEATHHYNRACMLVRLGRKTEGLESLKDALLMNQSLTPLAMKDTDLEPLRKDTSLEPQLSALGLTEQNPKSTVKEPSTAMKSDH